MKMKKFLALFICAAMVMTMTAVPVLSDYTEADYDIVNAELTFDDGTEINDIDGTKAYQVGDTAERVFSTSVDTTKEFLLTFDFRFDSDSALIQIPKYKSNGSVDKVGPRIKLSGGNLVTETSGSGTQALGSFTVGDWYTGEIEGKTGQGAQYTIFRLYSYANGEKELVQETKNFNMRNLSSENRSFGGITINNATIDNITLISEKPDEIIISATNDTVDAGQTDTLDYVMTRLGTEVTKYAVTWEVYDASGENAVSSDIASISSEGILSANIAANSQTVTVKASAVFGDKTLTGEKQIEINAVNTDDEKFDTVTVNGDSSVKAGTKVTYTFTASKGGADVTDDLADNDVVWAIYDYADINPIYTSGGKVSISDGVLTVADGTLPQTITVRASSQSGIVYGSKTVEVAFSDSQKEKVIYNNAFESTPSSGSKAVSVDGSTALLTDTTTTLYNTANQSGYTLIEMDVKFTQNNAGFILLRRDGQKYNTQVTYSNGTLKTNGGSLISGADTDTWYHVEVMYSQTDASCNIYTYDENGTLGGPKTSLGIDRRQADAFGRLDVYSGTYVDNVVIAVPIPNDVTITAPSKYMFAGESVTFTAEAARNGLPIKGASDLAWAVYDSDNLPIIDGSVTVSEAGVLTADAMAPAQTVKVAVSTAAGAIDSAEITIQSSEIFTVKNIGVNEEGTKIVRLYVDKNFYYNDDVAFIIAIHDSEGMLKDVKIIKAFGDQFSVGSNDVTVDYTLPSDFDPSSDEVSVMAWTSL